jgi:hypothetical protein
MNIQEIELPPESVASFNDLIPQINEYLDLEEADSVDRNVRYETYFTIEDSVGIAVFDYVSDDSPSFAFIQHSLSVNSEEPVEIGCWPRTAGKTLAWSIAEYLAMNPISDE